MSVTRFGKSVLLILFLAYLLILGGIIHYRTGPIMSKKFPYLIFKSETPPAVPEIKSDEIDRNLPNEANSSNEKTGAADWSTAETSGKFGQTVETFTYYPPTYSTVTTVDPPIPPATPIFAPIVTTWSPSTCYVTYSSPVTVPPPVVIQRPFFRSFIP